MNAHEVAELLANGGPIKPSSGQLMVRCPTHDDDTPSLSITDGTDATVLKCFAGCETEDILATANLTWADLFAEPLPNQSTEQTVYRYHDKDGHVRFEVVRGPGKRFRQRTPDRGELSGYRWNLAGVERVLYHLPDVMGAVREGHEVWITEGEKDADAVRVHGVVATTMPGGAGKWRDEYTPVLADATVTIWADADEVGRVHARNLRETLLPVAGQVRVVESAKGKDAYDHLGYGFGLDDVLVTVPYEQPDMTALFQQFDEFIDTERPLDLWAIPNVMRKREVLVLTGFEGMGKSSLLKQIAVCAAMGSNPFVPAAHSEPSRVLYIDCENPDQDCAEDFARLREAAREAKVYREDSKFWVHPRTELNLEKPTDLAWLIERVNAHQPDLLVIGPIYGMIGIDLRSEDAVHALKCGVTAAQATCDCAVILEHHAPHAVGGEERAIRPYGSSLLMRWPAFGFGLRPTDPKDASKPFEFLAWRGSRRRGRYWPHHLQQAKGWFWEEAEPPKV